uniref:Uncharacterized protein n=1 Tax=Coccidioides posadasii RMSCC 3488 TaxID=454284 RepID=A0A0J6FLH6_COCPO|nr:hypothetical protein CPAG_06034 [Coccidioides posadasii RMSCC 3488]
MEANNQNQNKKRYLSSKGEQAGLSVLIQKGKQTRSGSVEVVYSPKIPGGHERGKQCGVQSLEPWTLYEEQENCGWIAERFVAEAQVVVRAGESAMRSAVRRATSVCQRYVREHPFLCPSLKR